MLKSIFEVLMEEPRQIKAVVIYRTTSQAFAIALADGFNVVSQDAGGRQWATVRERKLSRCK